MPASAPPVGTAQNSVRPIREVAVAPLVDNVSAPYRHTLFSAGANEQDRQLYALTALEGSQYSLKRPLLLVVVWDAQDAAAGEYVATCDEMNVFGVGDTPDTAVSDFGESLVERYELLAEDESSLAAGLRRELAALRGIIGARS